jgi:hypothetical protein
MGDEPKIVAKLSAKKHDKQFALACAEKQSHKFTRVGREFFIKCEGFLKEFIRNHVHHLPSKGKTIN